MLTLGHGGIRGNRSIARSGGCKKRQILGDLLASFFSEQGYLVIDTNHGQTEGDYIYSIRETKFLFTTC